jgi:hypothetical protein
MAKGQLTFDLPEEQDEFERACKAGYAYCVISGLDGELRNHLKHNSHPEWDDATVEAIRKILWDFIADYGIQLD